MEPKAAVSPRPLARIAGGLYLINIVGGFFAIGYVPAAIVVAGVLDFPTFALCVRSLPPVRRRCADERRHARHRPSHQPDMRP